MSLTNGQLNQFHWHRQGATVTPSPLHEVFETPERRVLNCSLKKSQKQKYIKLFKLLLLTAVPTFIVIVQSIINVKEDLEMYNVYHYIKNGIKSSIQISDIVHTVQIERGTTALFVSSGGDPLVKQRLANLYKQTDLRISSFCKLAPVYENSNFRSCNEFGEYLSTFRQNLRPGNTTLEGAIRFYTNINDILIRAVTEFTKMERPFDFWTDLTAYVLLVRCTEETGIERALGSTYFARGVLPIEELLWYSEKSILGIQFLEQGLRFSDFAKLYLSTITDETFILDSIKHMRSEIMNNSQNIPSVKSGSIWFDNMTSYINNLKEVQDALAKRIVHNVEQDISDVEDTLIASAVQLTITVIMMPIVVVLVRNIVYISTKLKERTTDLEEEKRQTEALLHELEAERKRTEELLHQLLPVSVAKTLMENGCVDPESFDSVTIMFSDVVGFTTIASFSTPMQVVKMLNKLYMTIDGHLEHFDAYKVETIGDAYMVASGLPKRNGENHVSEIAKLATDLVGEHMEIPHFENETIRLRIGINTGPCVAGVVGIKMPRYCIFGDTVNTASRMESTGLPERIQMTESSASKLQMSGGFMISERGKVEVKGKGVMRTFWLDGKSKF